MEGVEKVSDIDPSLWIAKRDGDFAVGEVGEEVGRAGIEWLLSGLVFRSFSCKKDNFVGVLGSDELRDDGIVL